MSRGRSCLLLLVAAALRCAAGETVLVTGATGRTGSLVYGALKAKGVAVRAFVRSRDKAQRVLGCRRCDESEGVYLGDVRNRSSLDVAMTGATSLAILTSSAPVCPASGSDCYFHKGAYPVDIDFHGGRAQVQAFATALVKSGVGLQNGFVALAGDIATTDAEDYLEKVGGGHIATFKLNEEMAVMTSGLPFLIAKSCLLMDGPAARSELVVGHDRSSDKEGMSLARADLARVLVQGLTNPTLSAGLRFDLCGRRGPPTQDLGKLLESARLPWLTAAAPA